VSKSTGWAARLQVAVGGKGLVGHAGAILVRQCADRTGLTGALNAVLPRGSGPGWWDRGTVLACLATAIVLGATSMSDIGLLAHQALVFADPPSESTVRRALAELDETALRRIAKARARVRAGVWELLARRPQGFPWLCVAGKLLTGWVIIDMDATLITAHSDKQGAAATFKKGYGHHPLGAWCANTAEVWPCCSAPATPDRTRSPTTFGCWATRSPSCRCPTGARSWSGSTGPAPPTTS